MIFSVGSETMLRDVPSEAGQLHFVRPPKEELVKGILGKCKNFREVSLSKSCLERMPKKSLEMLRERGIRLVEAGRRGRPIAVPLEKMKHALEMRKDFQSLREVERVTGIAKSTVHYLEKYAERAKLKNGKRVIYLK